MSIAINHVSGSGYKVKGKDPVAGAGVAVVAVRLVSQNSVRN